MDEIEELREEVRRLRRALKHVHRILQRTPTRVLGWEGAIKRRDRMDELEAIAFEYSDDLMTDEEAF